MNAVTLYTTLFAMFSMGFYYWWWFTHTKGSGTVPV